MIHTTRAPCLNKSSLPEVFARPSWLPFSWMNRIKPECKMIISSWLPVVDVFTFYRPKCEFLAVQNSFGQLQLHMAAVIEELANGG